AGHRGRHAPRGPHPRAHRVRQTPRRHQPRLPRCRRGPAQGHRPVRTALVIGTGLIGTSAALALAQRGVTVHLADRDPEQARTAAALGAGTDEAPEGPVDLAIVAAPPAHVADVLADAMQRGLARGYADV